MKPYQPRNTQASRAKHLIEALRDENEKIISKIHGVAKENMEDFNGLFHTIGHWDCEKSPIGLCVYDHIEDRALDHCLYCGHPDERK